MYEQMKHIFELRAIWKIKYKKDPLPAYIGMCILDTSKTHVRFLL